MNLILIGYRCTGKTSVGKRLAEMLGMAFYDTDALIQEDNNQTIREIVAGGGWTAFRREEKRVIAVLALQDHCVIALGGGAVLDPQNIEVLRANGRIIWLTADLRTILERMEKDDVTAGQRPALLGKDSIRETARILEERTPIYEAAADLVTDTQHKSLDAIIQEILNHIS